MKLQKNIILNSEYFTIFIKEYFNERLIYLLIVTSSILLAFSSNYFPFKIQHHCDKTLHKTASDICYSCSRKEPDFVVYTLYGNLVNKK